MPGSWVDQIYTQAVGSEDSEREAWITLREVAKILGRKLYSVRTLEWDGEFGERLSGARPIRIKESAVLAYQRGHRSGGSRRTGATSSIRSKTSVLGESLNAVVLCKIMLDRDTTVKDATFRKKVEALFASWGKRLAGGQ